MSTRRPKYSKPEIDLQLQQLWIYSSLSSTAGAAGSTIGEVELGPILLNIHKSGQEKDYLLALQSFVAEKEAEIEQVCTSNYQVRWLL